MTKIQKVCNVLEWICAILVAVTTGTAMWFYVGLFIVTFIVDMKDTWDESKSA